MPVKRTSVSQSTSAAPPPKSTWWVYLIQTTAHTFYAGITTNPARRWRQHCGQLKGGAKYLKAFPPQAMVYLAPQPSHAVAAHIEAQLKKTSHQAKKAWLGKAALASQKYLAQWKISARPSF